MNNEIKQEHGIKEIVVVSGKGGTGKTTISSSLAEGFKDKVMVDADVEAANWYLLLHPVQRTRALFNGKPLAVINIEKCTGCGQCRNYCRFNAIEIQTQENRPVFHVDIASCDGCGLCQRVCRAGAVRMEPRVVGEYYYADTHDGPLVYARLHPGGENSGQLVAMVKKQAREIALKNHLHFLVIDGPPGIGCPVIAALSGANFVIVVTEPTLSGMSDLKRVLDLIQHFKIPCGVVINRFDIHPGNCRGIETYLQGLDIPLLACVPHSLQVMWEISRARVPVSHCLELQEPIRRIREYVLDFFTTGIRN